MSTKPRILAVDRNRRNPELLAELLCKEGYATLTGATVEEFEQALVAHADVALALVDLAGFDRRIWDGCERLRERGVPFLVLSHRRAEAVAQREGLSHGAKGVLLKPLAMRELLGMIRSLLGGGG